MFNTVSCDKRSTVSKENKFMNGSDFERTDVELYLAILFTDSRRFVNNRKNISSKYNNAIHRAFAEVLLYSKLSICLKMNEKFSRSLSAVTELKSE